MSSFSGAVFHRSTLDLFHNSPMRRQLPTYASEPNLSRNAVSISIQLFTLVNSSGHLVMAYGDIDLGDHGLS